MLKFLIKLTDNKVIKSFIIVTIIIFLISCDNKESSIKIQNNNDNNSLDEIGIKLPSECE